MKVRPALVAFLLWGSLPVHGAEPATFTRDVAPILWKHCSGCHRPGEVGPFPLLTYQDAAKRANFLRYVTGTRRMPPWRPDPDFGAFHGSRRLSEADLQTLSRWARAGAPEGDRAALPPAPQFVDGWQHGEPDLVVTMPEPFAVPAGGTDVYRGFVVPIPGAMDRTISAIEFRPGNRRVVFHVDLSLDDSGQARKRDRSDGQPGFASFGHSGLPPGAALGSWTPGAAGPLVFPEGTGALLKKGSDLVLQVHYHPLGKEQTDQSAVGLYFARTPPRRLVASFRVANKQLDIPAGEHAHASTARSDPLPADVRVLSVTPHMHFLGREITVTASLPDGRVLPLVRIKDWDFHWRQTYRLDKPLVLPLGTVIKLAAVFDNSADNPQNPSDPPRRVRWGERPTDEMLACSLQVIVETPADLRKLEALER